MCIPKLLLTLMHFELLLVAVNFVDIIRVTKISVYYIIQTITEVIASLKPLYNMIPEPSL